MAKIGIYLAFDNAKEAMNYYSEVFNAEIIAQLPITKEMNEYFNLPEDKLENSTYSGQFKVAGEMIACSDKVDNNGPFNDSFNIMMAYEKGTEDQEYFDMHELLHKATSGEIIFDSETADENTADMNMIRFKDKYDIIWSFVLV